MSLRRVLAAFFLTLLEYCSSCDTVHADDLSPKEFWKQVRSRRPLLVRGGGRQRGLWNGDFSDFLTRFGSVSVTMSTIPRNTSFEGLESDWPGLESFWRDWLGWPKESKRKIPDIVDSRRLDHFEACDSQSEEVDASSLCSVTGCFDTESCARFRLDRVVARPALRDATIADVLDAKARGQDAGYVQYMDLPDVLKSYVQLPMFAAKTFFAVMSSLEFCGLWLSGDRTTSAHLHMDDFENVFTQIAGERTWFLFAQDRIRRSIMLETQWGEGDSKQPVDVESASLSFFASASSPSEILGERGSTEALGPFQNRTEWRCETKAGDALYVPAGVWHEVESIPERGDAGHAMAMGVNWWWKPVHSRPFDRPSDADEWNPLYPKEHQSD